MDERNVRADASHRGSAGADSPGPEQMQGWVSCAACGQYFLHEPDAVEGETIACSLCGEVVVIGFLVRGSRRRTRWSREACDGATLAVGARPAARRGRGRPSRKKVRLGLTDRRSTPATVAWTLLLLAALILVGAWISGGDDGGRLTPFDAAYDLFAELGLGTGTQSPR